MGNKVMRLLLLVAVGILVTAGTALALPGGIAGTITGPGSVPLPGITVSAYSEITDDPGDQVLLATTTTDAQGGYLLPVAGTTVIVCFEGVGYAHECWNNAYRTPDQFAPRYGDAITVPPEGIAGIDAELVVGSSIAGTVSTSNGAGPAQVTVSAFLPDKLRYYVTTTEEDGSFTLTHLEPGTYVVCAYSATLIKRCTGDVGGPANYPVGEDDVVSGADIGFVPWPENLRIAETGADRIRWTWDPVPGATSYRVALSRSQLMTSPTLRWVSGTKASFVGLSAGTAYFVGVRAYGDGSLTLPSAFGRSRSRACRSGSGR